MRVIRGRFVAVIAVLPLCALGVLPPDRADAVSLEAIGTFETPTYVTSAPGDPDRLFVVERDGRIQLVENGGATLFLDIAPLVLSPPEPGAEHNEGGLFSIAFSPDFASDNHFYIVYRGADDPNTPADETGQWHLDEFEADGDVADPASRRDVLTIEYPGAALEQFHYGGQLQFGPDGYLYASTGDGGPQGDPNGNGQNREDLLGSILRIDPEGSEPGEYDVPPDNPYAGPTPGKDEIWSDGLRNPWRFSFDRLTGDLVIGDVGYEAREEVNFLDGAKPGKGANFGWNCFEGKEAFWTDPPCDVAQEFTDPVFEYEHGAAPGGCSVIGGYVVRDMSLGDLYGRYLFTDLCDDGLRSLDLTPPVTQRFEGLEVLVPVSLGEDSACRIYVTSFYGEVHRLVEPGAPAGGCPAAAPEHPTSPEPPAKGAGPLDSAALPRAARCAGKRATIHGGSGRQILRGTKQPDVIAAGGGRDVIRGFRGDDVICGGPGGDTLRGGRGDDLLRGGVSADELFGGRGPDTCNGGGAGDSAAGCAVKRRL